MFPQFSGLAKKDRRIGGGFGAGPPRREARCGARQGAVNSSSPARSVVGPRGTVSPQNGDGLPGFGQGCPYLITEAGPEHPSPASFVSTLGIRATPPQRKKITPAPTLCTEILRHFAQRVPKLEIGPLLGQKNCARQKMGHFLRVGVRVRCSIRFWVGSASADVLLQA